MGLPLPSGIRTLMADIASKQVRAAAGPNVCVQQAPSALVLASACRGLHSMHSRTQLEGLLLAMVRSGCSAV